MKKILYLSDLYYPAKGRNYYEEDLQITALLKGHFHILIGHPQQALEFFDVADFIVIRNTGPVSNYKEYFQKFRKVVQAREINTFNSLDGRGDIKGKKYLVEFTRNGEEVIPTIDDINDLDRLGPSDQYVVKPIDGADSHGMKIVGKNEVFEAFSPGQVIQPYIKFLHELSFVFLNGVFQYATFAPDKSKRWDLKEFDPSPSDLTFAQKFADWNTMTRGIQRVDVCRLENRGLLLVELEDINPFLSIDVLSEGTRARFLDNFLGELRKI